MTFLTFVTATDARYFDYARSAILSIRHKAQGRDLPFHVLDLGLTEFQREWMRRWGCTLVDVPWDYEFPGRDSAPRYFRAMTARPNLPRHIPGFDVYFWIDADAWVQDWAAVSTYIEAAATTDAAFVPEVDRAYTCNYDHGQARNWMHRCYAQGFGAEVADRFADYPIINSGVFAARADSPLWSAWTGTLAAALQRSSDFFVEQTALNVAVYAGQVRPAMLPATHNWHLGFGRPTIEAESGDFLTHRYPVTRAGILHMCGVAKNGDPLNLVTTDGQSRAVDPRYPGWQQE